MAGPDIHIRVLGPCELVHAGRVMPVGPVSQAVLPALAAQPDTMVWGVSDTVSVDALYHHITRLRRALAPVGLDIVGHRPATACR
jgi:hypothetical protein